MRHSRSSACSLTALLRCMPLVLALCTGCASVQTPGASFRLVSTFQNIGLILTSVVGPGPVPGSQRLYASISYAAGTFDILSIDPDTGATTVLHSPIRGESAVWNMATGPDGNIYMGTGPTGHFVKLDTAKGTLVDLGTPSSTETFIWAVAFGSDHKLYGGTYPNCKLVRFDPASGRMEDLGRLDPIQQYARFLTGTSDGFIYAGIGSAAANVVGYEIASGRTQGILPAEAQVAGFAHTYLGADNRVYSLAPTDDFRISGWKSTPIPSSDVPPTAQQNVFADGRTVTLGEQGGKLVLSTQSAAGEHTLTLDYAGEPNALFRIAMGPDGNLYASGAMPSDLVRIDATSGAVAYLGRLGDGEAYSILPFQSSLLLGTYADKATLASYNLGSSFSAVDESANPKWVSIPGDDICWRTEAMIADKRGTVFVGAQAGYGKLGGPLLAWNPLNNSVTEHPVLPDQSIASLAAWNNSIVGGTTIFGGLGSQSTATDAELFIWDPEDEEVKATMVPVPGARTITDLVTAPNGLVYGFADSTFFEFDPGTQRVKRTQQLSFRGLIYNSMAIDRAGRAWGLSSQGIFTIDTAQMEGTLIGKTPNPITGGFAFANNTVYFISGPAVYAYAIPATLTSPVTVSSSTGNATSGGPITLTAAIDARNGLKPGGQITFLANGVVLGTSPLVHGRASLSASGLPPGANQITARYSGDSYFAPAESGSFTVTNGAPTGFGPSDRVY